MAFPSTLKMQAIHSSGILVDFYSTAIQKIELSNKFSIFRSIVYTNATHELAMYHRIKQTHNVNALRGIKYSLQSCQYSIQEQ
jgi:hypothetical protein